MALRRIGDSMDLCIVLVFAKRKEIRQKFKKSGDSRYDLSKRTR